MASGFLRNIIWLIACPALFLANSVSAQNSAQPIFENDRVRITTQDLQKDRKLPGDRRYDIMTVQLADGDTLFAIGGKLARQKNTRVGDVHYFPAMSKGTLSNPGERPLPFVELQFLRPQGKYSPLDVPRTHYCNPGAEKSCVTEQYLFCTDRFCVETVTLDPGAVSTQHTHDADHIVIPTSNFRWREETSGQPSTTYDFKVGEVKYVRAGGTHRLINVGENIATMVVVQFK